MGVKDLWGIISPTSRLIKLQDIDEKIVAVDLSCWICDSQNVNMGGSIIRPHLRNLFFRTLNILKAGLLPVFVLEGEAPNMKLCTIQKRMNKHSNQPANKSCSGSRARLKGLLKQCQELLIILGLPWIQARGEAEATCAALAYHNLVDGVITQDSDVILYGAEVIFRNFSGNEKKTTVEKYKAADIESKLGLSRESLVCLAVLVGCDYLPAGVPGVGKENALKLVKLWNEKGVEHPLQRMQHWNSAVSSNREKVVGKEKQRKGERPIEEVIAERALKTDGFPFSNVTEEFLKKLPKPKINIRWTVPEVSKLVYWCVNMLGWEAEYAFDKVIPLATLWIITYSLPYDCHFLQPVEIIQNRIRQGIHSYEVTWNVSLDFLKTLPSGMPSKIKVTEPAYLLKKSFPTLVQNYEASVVSKKKGKTSRVKVKKISAKKLVGDKENLKSKVDKQEKPEVAISDTDDSVDEAELSRIINNLGRMKISSCTSQKFQGEGPSDPFPHQFNGVNQDKNQRYSSDTVRSNNFSQSFVTSDKQNQQSEIKHKYNHYKIRYTDQRTLGKCLNDTKYCIEPVNNKDYQPPITRKIVESQTEVSVINISSDFEDDNIDHTNSLQTGQNFMPTLRTYDRAMYDSDYSYFRDTDSKLAYDDFPEVGNCSDQFISLQNYQYCSVLPSRSVGDPHPMSSCSSTNDRNVSKDMFDDSEITDDHCPDFHIMKSSLESRCINIEHSKGDASDGTTCVGRREAAVAVKSLVSLNISGGNLESQPQRSLNCPKFLLPLCSGEAGAVIKGPSNTGSYLVLSSSSANICPLSASVPANISAVTEQNPFQVSVEEKAPISVDSSKMCTPVKDHSQHTTAMENHTSTFVTPRADALSLAERLRRRYGGQMDGIIDKM